LREIVFVVPLDIPAGTRKVNELKWYLEAQRVQLGTFGKDGRSVGIGFEWETRTGLATGGLAAVLTLARRIQRAFMSTGILHRTAEVYLLGARIRYIRDGNPKGTFTIKEG
jgi:hypothetical protein